MSVVFEKTQLLTDKQFHYCPGCNHGIIHRLVAESIDELVKEGKLEAGNVIGVAPVGCSVFAYDYFNCDMFEAAHGRAPAVATGIKRAKPDTLVFTYQGDGDLASIGTAEWSSPIRATATWPPSAPPRSSMPRTAARSSSPFSSTTPFTA